MSRPVFVVKYGAAVGDTFVFKSAEGVKVTRTVASKSTTDDYPIGFWLGKGLMV